MGIENYIIDRVFNGIRPYKRKLNMEKYRPGTDIEISELREILTKPFEERTEIENIEVDEAALWAINTGYLT